MEDKEGSNSKKPIIIGTPSPSPSPVKIGAIQIDLSGYPTLEQNKSSGCHCNHKFSIRRYVAEMRKKNINACFPFPLMDGDHNQSRNRLPPLEVPNFIYWKCQNCVKEINNLAGVAASSNTGEKDLQPGIMESGFGGISVNGMNPLIDLEDEVEDIIGSVPFRSSAILRPTTSSTLDHSPPASQLNVNWADQYQNRHFNEKRHGEAVGSLSSRNNEISGGINSRGSRSKSSNFRTTAGSSTFGLVDNNKQILQKKSDIGAGSSNFIKAGETGIRAMNTSTQEINQSVFLGGKAELRPGSSSRQTEMSNLPHHLTTQMKSILTKMNHEIEIPMALNRIGWPSYTSLLMGIDQQRTGMENPQIPRMAPEGVGNNNNNKRKRIFTDVEFSQKTRSITELMMDSERKAQSRDLHVKDSGNAAICVDSISISSSSSKESEARKNLLGLATDFQKPRKNLLCDLNEEIPPHFEMPISNHQAQPCMDLSSDDGGGDQQAKGADEYTTKHIVELLARNLYRRRQNVAETTSPILAAGKNSEIRKPIQEINQAVVAASADLYKNHLNIEQIAKNAEISNFSRQRAVESRQASRQQVVGSGKTSSPRANAENWINPSSSSSNNNNNKVVGEKEIPIPKKKVEKINNLSLFEKYTENPWISKRFKIDLNKEAIDPSEAIPAMQLLSLKNATGFKPSSGFAFGTISSPKTWESSSSTEPAAPGTIKFGPAYLSTGKKESITPFQSQLGHEPETTTPFQNQLGHEPKDSNLNSEKAKPTNKKPLKERDSGSGSGSSSKEGLTKSNRSNHAPSRSININAFCSINKNPAEFTVPGTKNEYMISGKDLKMGKGVGKATAAKGKGKAAVSIRGKRSRSRAVVADGRKRKK